MSNLPRWLLFLNLLYVLLLVSLTTLNSLGPDRWWIGAMNLYLPQALWLAPGLLLLFVTALFCARMIWMPLLCLLWVLGPIMGLRWRFSEAPSGKAPDRLRVMTWNTKYGIRHSKVLVFQMMREIELQNPDLLLCQDGTGLEDGPMGDYLKKWQVRSIGQYLVASRYPLSEPRSLPIPIPGEPQFDCLRCELTVGGRKLVIYNVHLQTPRQGLNAFRVVKKNPDALPSAIGRLEENVDDRFLQARTLVRYLSAEKGPVLLAGDLNSPDASLTCRMLRATGLKDAFAGGGRGYGYTYGHFLLLHRLPWLQSSWMRIDHIMTTDDLKVLDCWTGTRTASDHRPVIADLVWTNR